MATDPTYERLSLDHLSEVVHLLETTWPELYGATGCPRFSDEYLGWLYGGPESERSLLYGCRHEGNLVGFKAYLRRDLRRESTAYNGHLATHLAVRPGLDLSLRLSIARELARLHVLETGQSDVVLAFFEANKQVSRSTRLLCEREGLEYAERPVRQHVVDAGRLRRAIGERVLPSVRAASSDDVVEVLALRERRVEGGLWWAPSDARYWHHAQRAPGAVHVVCTEGSRVVGAVSAYCLDWIKGANSRQVMVVEDIVADSHDAGLALLSDIEMRARERAVRGIVIENPSLVGQGMLGAVVIPSMREMLCSLRARSVSFADVTDVACDVK